VGGVVVWEVAGLGAAMVDGVAVLDDQTPSTTVLGPVINTTRVGELVIAGVRAAAAITGTAAGNEFVDDDGVNGDGFGHLADNHAPAGDHQPAWTQSGAGQYCVSVVAFAAGP
jgi:hypothetical protein